MPFNQVIRRFFVLVAVIFCAVCAYAQSASDSSTVHKFRILYPVNETTLHEDYLGNTAALRSIREHFKKSPRIDSIMIYSYASPEGPFKQNQRLAKERGEHARNYLLKHIHAEREFPDSLIIVKPIAENWEGLYEMVERYYPYEDKQEVIDILTMDGISQDKRKQLLKHHNHGISWGFIKAKILPNLRYATWVAEWIHVPTIMEHVPSVPGIIAGVETTPQADILKPVVEEKNQMVGAEKTILALKTNLLYDLLTLVNFSIEFPLYKDKLSILYYHQCPWWTWGKGNNEFCTRFLSIGGEARWWFKTKDRFQGHFLGAYAESGKYDFEYQRKICYQGEFYSAGLSYGYAMPVGRHLNLEFSISAGYASIPYRGYSPSGDYEILWRDPDKVGRLHYFGPTKAQVSLVIPIRVTTKGGNEL